MKQMHWMIWFSVEVAGSLPKYAVLADVSCAGAKLIAPPAPVPSYRPLTAAWERNSITYGIPSNEQRMATSQIE